MHRRNRHFKGGSVGCNLQLDARYLSQSDGTAISSWTDRSINAYNASQATSNKQPLIKTGVNGINGSTAVNFDGSNDGLTISNYVNNSDMFIIFAVKITTANMIFEHSPNTNSSDGFYVYGQSGNNIAIRRFGSPGYNILGTNNWIGFSPAIVSFRHSTANGGNYYLNGNVITKVNENGVCNLSSNTTNTFYIMTRGDTGLFTNALLGAVIVGSGDLSETLRKRIQVSLAYSFKIACS